MPNPSSAFRYRVRNWHKYNRALINRCRLTVLFDEQAIAAWRNTEPAVGPGAPRVYTDLAIECALVFKAVHHLSLRAAHSFLSSVVELMRLTLPIPDYCTVSRRPTYCPRANPIERAFGDVHDKCTRNHTRKRMWHRVQDVKRQLRGNGPWPYVLSDLYYTPEVTAAVVALQAADISLEASSQLAA